MLEFEKADVLSKQNLRDPLQKFLENQKKEKNHTN